AALAEERQEPRRHRPRGRDEAVDVQVGLPENALALFDARAPLGGRDVAHLGLAARRDPLCEEPAEPARGSRRVVVLAALMKEAVEVDLVPGRLGAAPPGAEPR